MKELFTEAIYRPLFNALAWLYENVAFEDLGIAIIILTLIVRVVLFPLFQKTAKHQQVTQNLQPEIKKIQKKHKQDKEAQAKELIELYNEHKINPMTPLVALLVQLPIVFVLYRIFINGFSQEALQLLYPFIQLPDAPAQTFLGVIDLTQSSIWIAAITAAAQFAQGKISLSSNKKKVKGQVDSKAEKMGKWMLVAMPAIAFIALLNFPAAVGIYWLTTTVFSVFQQVLVKRSLNKEEAKRLSLGGNGEGQGQN